MDSGWPHVRGNFEGQKGPALDVSDGRYTQSDSPVDRTGTVRGAHWQNLANTIEPSVFGGDAALRQIILTSCY